eukprot:g10943.t1
MWRLALLLLLPPLHRSEECSSFLQTAESKTIEPEREDVFHYLVGFEEGGYMADSGVTCEKPIDQFPVPKNATMIVGYEFGHRFTEVQRKKANFARTEQFAKYFFASAPGNPILKRCLQLVRQRYTWKVQAPQDLTGAATFSDAVHEFLDKNTPEALEHEISIRQNRPSLHFLSYPSERRLGADLVSWTCWMI